VAGGGGWAGSVLVANSVPGPPPRPGMSGTAEHEGQYRCQLMPPRKKSSGVGGPDRWDAPSYDAHFPVLVLFVEWGRHGVRGRVL
jgi:hypothetical protein